MRRTELTTITRCNTEAMAKFADTIFGQEPDGLIYVMNLRPSKTEDGKLERKPYWYTSASKLNSTRNRDEGHKWGMIYCTSTIAEDGKMHKAENVKSTPIVWCDIDACKQLGVDGSVFFNELYHKEDSTVWIRSSANGIQTVFKLDEPILNTSNKEVFEAELSPLLWNICWYYGGDYKTTNAQNLMRLPGSLNIKAEYEKPWEVLANYPNESYDDTPPYTYTLPELKKRFSKDVDRVPKVVSYAIMEAISKSGAMNTESNIRHYFMVALAGTLRRGLMNPKNGDKRIGGINKKSALNLFKEIAKFFQDDEVRESDINTTYDRDEGEKMATLWSLKDGQYKETHQQISEIVHFWVDLKKRYCKEMGSTFKGELLDQDYELAPENSENEVVLVAPDPNGDFKTIIEKDYVATLYLKKGKDDSGEWLPFSNFVIIPKFKLRKEDGSETVWIADVHLKGHRPKEIEIDSVANNDIKAFRAALKTAGIAVEATNEWNRYIIYLNSICPDKMKQEIGFYGLMDADNDEKPTTMLLPGRPHDEYVWKHGNEDTANKKIFMRDFTRQQKIEYLTGFGERYPLYHEPRYLYSALGWFCGAPLSSVLRHTLGGFPTMMIAGLAGLGKTTIISHVLAPQMGCKPLGDFGNTTKFANTQKLLSNNLVPHVIDEFRATDIEKVKQYQATIRSLWDSSTSSSGRQDRSIVTERYVTPLCMLGEHHYTDEATMHRTLSVRVDRTWIDYIRTLTLEEYEVMEDRKQWLEATRHGGILGTLLIEWLDAHLEEVPAVIEWAKTLVEKTCPVKNERKRVGYMGVFAGLYMLSKIYAEYEVPFFLKKKAMLEHVYGADSLIEDFVHSDTAAFRTLFQLTDDAIMTGNLVNRPLMGAVFVKDIKPQQEHIIYFDSVRWFYQIKEKIKGNASATINDLFSFQELLKDASRKDDNPIVSLPTDHPLFKHNCVKVDLNLVQSRFNINTDQWLVDFIDELN